MSFGSGLLFVGILEELSGNCQNLRKFWTVRKSSELVEALIVSENRLFELFRDSTAKVQYLLENLAFLLSLSLSPFLSRSLSFSLVLRLFSLFLFLSLSFSLSLSLSLSLWGSLFTLIVSI